MRRSTLATAGLLIFAATLGSAAIAKGRVATPVAAPAASVTTVDNFRLVTAAGRSEDLYRYSDAKAVVIVMHAVGSPQVRAMAPKLRALQEAYEPKGVKVLMLNSTAKDSREAVLAETKALGLGAVPVMMDDNLLVGDQLGATRVSEVFVIDPKSWKTVYHGALADGAKGDVAARALDALIAGQPVTTASVPASGAAISFPDRLSAAKARFATISYAKEIVPILEEKCVACHQQGGIAPFAFDSYEKVKGFSPMIRETIRTDRMPPWDVDPKVGHFKNDKSLTPAEIKTLVRWIEAGRAARRRTRPSG
ncbi:redoxin domain-containing protein [Phenylobacterium sp. J426]|uniref:redoxin family protein n=1 Tax=Phenylobacterium sp. J426 TaxID=2898439 RepID=UPI00215180F8|nr:redoxin family protein [Phenylobacterium sp. J426]MCR5875464.1 redoxin domain-containing protein [Phenylobacterium sp. J426]